MTFQEINFEPSFIDVCVDSLLNFKRETERYDPDEVWSSGILSRLNHLDHWSEDIPLLMEAKDALRSLAGVKDVLEYLLKSLQNTTKTVAKALLPFQRGRGLASLPDDVLSMIFVHAGSKSTLDLVCRRFRQVASVTPQLWSSISNAMQSMRLVNASLKESKAVGLDIELYPNSQDWKYQLDVLQVLDAAVVHIDRWEELSISYEYETSWQEIESCITQMGERTKNFHIPQLRTLHLSLYDGPLDDEDVLNESDSAIHFYRTWSLPSLRHLQVDKFVPVPFATRSLTSLSMDLQSIYLDDDRQNFRRDTLLRLFRFLSSVPYLEDLELFFNRLDEYSDLPSIVLHPLKIFRMECAVWVVPQVFCIPKALTTPAIRSMHLSIVDESYPFSDVNVDLTQWLDKFFCHDTYPTLEEFNFEFSNSGDDSREFKIPFEKLRNLRKLTLDTSDWLPWRTGILPPLRSLHLKGRVDDRWQYWLCHVKEKIQEQGNLTEFQNLTIEVKGDLNKNDIERSFSKNCVVWR